MISSRRFVRRRGVYVATLFAVLVETRSATALVTSCVGANGLCASTSPCSVQTLKEVQPGAILDCSDVDVRISGSGSGILVTDGRFVLRARTLTVDQGRSIQAVSSTAPDSPLIGFELVLSGDLILNGQFLADHRGGGSEIAVAAKGSIVLAGSNPAIRANGLVDAADGGDVILAALGPITLGKDVLANGNGGVSAANASEGGMVAVSAGGALHVDATISSVGQAYSGGDVTLSSGTELRVNYGSASGGPKGQILVEGRGVDSDGGFIRLESAGLVRVAGKLLAAGGVGNSGGQAAGGRIDVRAGCAGVAFVDFADVQLSGGAAGGGVMNVASDGDVALTGAFDLRSRQGGGDGGVAKIVAGKLLQLSPAASVDVSGHDGTAAGVDGRGGEIFLSGCSTQLLDSATLGATLRSTGFSGGKITMQGRNASVAATASSLAIGDRCFVDSRGGAVSIASSLQVAVTRSGTCSNQLSKLCTLNSQCLISGIQGTCRFRNPDTEGTLVQFAPSPTVSVVSGISTCSVCY